MKLEYFRQHKWEDDWIEEAENMVREELRVLIYKESFFRVWGLPKNCRVIFLIDYKLCYKLCDRGNKRFEALLHF